MKYTILGFSQQALLDYGLDVSDALILRTLADMYVSNNVKIEYRIFDNDKYMWITYPYIYKEIPIINQRTLIRRIDSLIEKGILKKVNTSSKNGKKGNYLYISFGDTYSKITEYKSSSEPDAKMELGKNKSVDFKEPDATLSLNPMPKWHDKDLSTTNPSTKNKTTTKYKPRYIKHKSSCYKFKISRKKSNSSSSCEEIKKIKQLLLEKTLNEKTCNNILEAVKKNSLTLEKVKEAFEFAKAKNKGVGYIVDSLKFNWNNSLVAKPTIKKSDSIEKENQFIKKRELEKEEASKQLLPDVELTPKLEEELREKAITIAGIKPDVLNTMKNKSKKTYINTLKQFLTA
ncbi:MAG: hypothetical protein ACRC4T_19735 [Cetobacterium sp.]